MSCFQLICFGSTNFSCVFVSCFRCQALLSLHRSHRLREADRHGVQGRDVLHNTQPVPVRVSGVVQGGARVRGRQLQVGNPQRFISSIGLMSGPQLRGERPEESGSAGDTLPAAEQHPGQEPGSAAQPRALPVLHGQDEHQIGYASHSPLLYVGVPEQEQLIDKMAAQRSTTQTKRMRIPPGRKQISSARKEVRASVLCVVVCISAAVRCYCMSWYGCLCCCMCCCMYSCCCASVCVLLCIAVLGCAVLLHVCGGGVYVVVHCCWHELILQCVYC